MRVRWAVFFLLAVCGAVPDVRSETSNCAPLAESSASSLTIEIAEARLDRCNRDILAAYRTVEAATADRMTAGQRANPTLTLGANNINPRIGIGSGNLRDKTIDSSVRLEQLFERGGKLDKRQRQYDALLAASRSDLAEVRRLQRLATRSAYFDLAVAQARRRLTQEATALFAQTLTAAEKRQRAGDIAPADVNRIKLDAARAGNDARQAEADSKRLQIELAKLIGIDRYAQDLTLKFAVPHEDATAAETEISDALFASRGDVSAARQRVAAAEAARDLALSSSTRDWTVGVQFDRWPVSEANPQGTGNSFGVSLSVPLFLHHANEGEKRRAQVDFDTARDMLARQMALARAEAALSHAEYAAAAEKMQRVERDILPVAQEVARAAEFAYNKGATGVLDLLDARRSLRQVQVDAVSAQGEFARAWARWKSVLEATSNIATDSAGDIHEMP